MFYVVRRFGHQTCDMIMSLVKKKFKKNSMIPDIETLVSLLNLFFNVEISLNVEQIEVVFCSKLSTPLANLSDNTVEFCC